MKKRQISIAISIVVFAALFGLIAPVQAGMNTVQGHVYDTDGVTAVDGVDVTVTDINTGDSLSGTTKWEGFYSVVFGWPGTPHDVTAGDTLEIVATYGALTNTTTVTATGVSPQIVDLTLQSTGPVTTGDININEIMYKPADSDSWYEWIELYNNDTQPINVSGWILNGTIGGTDTILSGTLGLGEYKVLAKNVTAFQARYPDATCAIIKGNWSALASNETIDLWDSASTLNDSVTYTDIATENNTIELNATGWYESKIEGGTPCRPNSVQPPTLTVTATPTTVYVDVNTSVLFTVTSDGIPVDNATVNVSGCGVSESGLTNATGRVTLWVNATSTGTINVIANKTGYDDGTTTITATTTMPALTVTATPSVVYEGVNTSVLFNVTSDGIPVDNATVNVSGCGVSESGLTNATGLVTLWVNATSTGAINVIANKTGYDDGTTTITATTTMPALTVTATPSVVYVGENTSVLFTVTSDGTPVDNATVNVSGCGVDVSGLTNATGLVTLWVNATSTGTINVIANKTGYDDGTTTVSAVPVITYSNLTVTPTEGVVPLDITASAKVENVGNDTEDYNASFKIDDAIVTWETGTLNAGENITVSFEHTFEDAATYSVTIDELTPIEVVVEVTPTPTPRPRRGGGGGPPRDTDGDGISDIKEMIAGTDKADPCDPNPKCAACLALKPAATPTPTAAPTAAPTAKPTTPPVPTPKPTAEPTPTPEPPGFEAVFAIAGLLAVAYLVVRKKRK